VSSLIDISDAFAGSPEFNLRYGALGNPAFVTLVYRNVLNRDPDKAGLDASVAFLGRGARRGEVMLGFSESPEFNAKPGAAPSAPAPPPAPAPTPRPAVTSPSLPLNVGGAHQFPDGSSVQVFAYGDSSSTLFPPDPGNKLVAIDAQVCAGDKPVAYNELGFDVAGADNRRYPPTFSTTKPSLGSGTLGSGCIRGYVTFEVPQVPAMTTIFWDYPGWGLPVSWSRCNLTGC